MRNHRDSTSECFTKVTSLLPGLVAVLGVALGGCTNSINLRGLSGAAGGSGVSTGDQTTGDPMNTVSTGGPISVPVGDATPVPGTSCSGGSGGGPPLPPSRSLGIPPQLPTAITHAATPVPPISGGTLLALSDGATAFAADPERDQASFVDIAGAKVIAQVTLQPGDEPGRAVEDAKGFVHVALRRGGAVATLDPTTHTVSSRQAVCSAPRGIAYDAATDLVHVACAGGELVSLPAAGGAATRTLTLDRDLRDVVVVGASLYVSTFRRAEVLIVGADGTVTGRMQPGSGMVPSLAGGMPEQRSPAVAWRMVSYGDVLDTVVMLHETGDDSLVDPAAGGYGGVKGCGAIVQAGVTVLTPGAQPTSAAAGMEMVSLAVDIAMAPDGKTAAIAVPGNAETNGLPTIVTVDTTQMTTGNPCMNASQLAVGGQNGASGVQGQVVAVSYAKNGTLLAQTREPAAVYVLNTSPSGTTTSSISLATDSRDDTGHTIFHVNAGGGVACASCHPEGGEDGRVWNFACAGARRTQSIRGGISPTAPFHWDGSEPTFSHLMDDVFSGRMSGPILSDDQKSALQSWVDTIPAMPVTAGLDAAAVARGQTLFTNPTYACATCHAGALLTNNTTVDVGTGAAFQVPSLRGVAWRAPFMHTGCAETLADRFDAAAICGGGDKHGMTSTLTAAQVGDLVTYLQSL
jgi:hypothetical protein